LGNITVHLLLPLPIVGQLDLFVFMVVVLVVVPRLVVVVGVVVGVSVGVVVGVIVGVLLGVAVIGAFLVAVEPGRRTAAGAPEAVLAAFAYAGVLIALGQSNLPDLTTVGVTRTVSVLAILPAFLLVRELRFRGRVAPQLPLRILLH
jgi:hypothetical protein